MKVLVIGGTRFMGIHLVHSLIINKHDVTIATRGMTPDDFGSTVKRIIIDRSNGDSIRNALSKNKYDIVYDNLAYCSNDVKLILENLKCEKYILLSSTAVYDKHPDTEMLQKDYGKYIFTTFISNFELYNSP